MLAPDHSGVCFTIGPTPKTQEVSVVECVPGLGEQLVSGARTPHYFEVDPAGQIVNRRSPKNDFSQPPNDQSIVEVVRVAQRLAGHFGVPQDVEWAVMQGQVYVLQARPITVFGGSTKAPPLVLSTSSVIHTPRVGQVTGRAEAAALRDDLHDWMIEHIEPSLFRGAAFIVNSQKTGGCWEVEGHPEWNVVSTALIVSLIIDGGVPTTCRWLTRSGHSGGLPLALAWLASQTKSDGTWGTDLWDTCQVVRALLHAGVSPEVTTVRTAIGYVRDGVLDNKPSSEGAEWYGAGFLAAALRVFTEVGDLVNARNCATRLVASQAPDGDFLGPEGSPGGGHTPSEWHTAQVISALSFLRDSDVINSAARAKNWLLARQQGDGSWGPPDGPYQHFRTFFTAYAVLALLDFNQDDRSAAGKACRWLKQQQAATGSFGDIASCLMAVAALQRYHGQALRVLS